MLVVITGGTGFVGRHLAKTLLARDDEVRIRLFDKYPDERVVTELRGRVEVVRGDLASCEDVFNALSKDVDTVFHCGALLSEAAERQPQAAFRTNLLGTWHVLEAARIFEIEHVVFTSTIATFGRHIDLERVGEDSPQFPTTMYGVTKVASERLGEYYHHKYGIDFRGVRGPSIVGPGRKGGGVSAYTSLMIQEAALGREYVVYVDGRSRIPILYIKDFVKGLLMLWAADESRLSRRVYNLGGVSPTAAEIAEAVLRHIPAARISFRPHPEMQSIVDSWPRALDDTHARRDWGWKVDYTLDSLVQDFIEELRRNAELYT